ncbi:hypothetical protein C4901_16695 [Acidiferrobacter sp. SPIII_3]|jgi:hypothetical protein|uniref:UvrD-helicase domain-containing protein n=1 Tax=Acidiferrobacter sp. SPIII_3 TaxID=1281578 RepID=UPI000D72A94D|nr:UvrD-helicase domain-containing protein [Acidiferrobacter sp. SPIII_3]AWP24753.1 hypothetical protein C4901_16695 [Acidiferrobacter sp. SPIII_3]
MDQPLQILTYTDFDPRGLERAYAKVAEALAQGDFHAAQVKKLRHATYGKLYRARLNDADRLLFSLVKHGEQTALLMLEVIRQHDYASSRFLRGAEVSPDKIQDADPVEARREATPLRYWPKTRTSIHVLDKPLSFDDTQAALFVTPAPLILVGGAGSGKTALLLEKLKTIPGDVLYITHSAYLAEHARELYYAHDFVREGQEAAFLSYRDYLETWRIPEGREASWRDFSAWFARIRQNYKGIDAHQIFEEIRGVITARAEGVLDYEAYKALGVRQSIFAADQRAAAYDVFVRYQSWLKDHRFFDLNLLAHAWKPLVQPCYDFVVIDEVQDLTAIQLSLVLAALRKPGAFVLGGDANQIVHPNFFSWAQIKSLFWADSRLNTGREVQVLTHNFRNGRTVTQVANRLLEIKRQRFGSIDRESNFLVEAVGEQAGAVQVLDDARAGLSALNQQISKSTQYAVLVLREEDKAAARALFTTPLLFSVQEAKGLEYPHIVLYRFLSDHRATFAAICEGVRKDGLGGEALTFRRAKDKGDRSLDAYKFFVNALYVAITRAADSVYLVESDHNHPLLNLLDVQSRAAAPIVVPASSRDEWQKEAHKLELQGKLEQAEAIRANILQTKAPPWPVADARHVGTLIQKVLVERAVGNKGSQQLFEYAAFYDAPELAERLARERQFSLARHFVAQRPRIVKARLASYSRHHFNEIWNDCERYGLEHRTPMNQTPLMAAARAGNVPLVEALLEKGARRDSRDHLGRNAAHIALREAFTDPEFAQTSFPALWGLLAPLGVDLRINDRLVRLEKHQAEYFLFQTLWALIPNAPVDHGLVLGFRRGLLERVWARLPDIIVPPNRKQGPYISGLLARNEINRDYAYNRRLFVRAQQGVYLLQSHLYLRDPDREGEWRHWTQAHNLEFLQEHLPVYRSTFKAVLNLAPRTDTPSPPESNPTLKARDDGPPKEASPPSERDPAMVPQEDGACRERCSPNPDDQQNLPFFEIDEGRSSGDDADA